MQNFSYQYSHHSHPAWVEINMSQFKKNISLLKTYLQKSLICIPVKANAYGHGLIPMAKAAQETACDYLAVAHLQEGVLLRQSGISLPILVLGALHEEQILDLIQFDLEFTISSIYKAKLVAQKCQQYNLTCKIHIEVDTGMQRTGVRIESTLELFNYLTKRECFLIKGIYSHLATGYHFKDSLALEQIKNFSSLFNHTILKKVSLIRHLANSNGVLFFSSAQFDMVRPGLLAYGYKTDPCPLPLASISPCFSVKSKIAYFKVVEEGKGVSYGHSYFTSKQTRIVTIPLGYGDGYRSSLSNRAYVLIRGRRFPIVGKICMDQFMVDIGNSEAYVGDEVVIIGKQGQEEVTVQEIALFYNTHIYEVLTSFNERLPRRYI